MRRPGLRRPQAQIRLAIRPARAPRLSPHVRPGLAAAAALAALAAFAPLEASGTLQASPPAPPPPPPRLPPPWIRTAVGFRSDNQPYRRAEVRLEAGVYLAPYWTVAASGAALSLGSVEAPDAGEAAVEVRGYVAPLQLGVAVRAGGSWQSGGGEGGGGGPGMGGQGGQGAGGGSGASVAAAAGSTWIGAVEAAAPLPAGFRLVAAARRERYLWTAASADTLLPVEAAELRLDRANAPRWAGEAVARLDRYTDGNRTRTAYAWIMAPVAPVLRLGYAFAWSDADESRWSPDPAAGGAGSQPAPGSTVPGRYHPYFTPEQERVHSVLAELTGDLGGARARLGANVGVHAREASPGLVATEGGGTRLVHTPRRYTPWEATAELSAPVGDGAILTVAVEGRGTVFYRLFGARVSAVWFPGGGAGR